MALSSQVYNARRSKLVAPLPSSMIQQNFRSFQQGSHARFLTHDGQSPQTTRSLQNVQCKAAPIIHFVQVIDRCKNDQPDEGAAYHYILAMPWHPRQAQTTRMCECHHAEEVYTCAFEGQQELVSSILLCL